MSGIDESVPETRLRIATLPNLRDIGGWPTRDGGRLRSGLLYRSVALGKLDDEGLASFGRLGIRTVFDLRTSVERAAEPDRVPPGTQVVELDVLGDGVGDAPAQLIALMHDPGQATGLLGDGKAEVLFDQAYRHIVGLPSALAAYRELYTRLALPASRPALIHCTTGKDRTGWGTAALLLLLGVDEADVRREYLLTNAELLPALQPIFDAFTTAGGDPELLRAVLGVRAEYLAAAMDEMTTRFGDIEGYFADGLGIDADGQERLRETLVQRTDLRS